MVHTHIRIYDAVTAFSPAAICPAEVSGNVLPEPYRKAWGENQRILPSGGDPETKLFKKPWGHELITHGKSIQYEGC